MWIVKRLCAVNPNAWAATGPSQYMPWRDVLKAVQGHMTLFRRKAHLQSTS